MASCGRAVRRGIAGAVAEAAEHAVQEVGLAPAEEGGLRHGVPRDDQPDVREFEDGAYRGFGHNATVGLPHLWHYL